MTDFGEKGGAVCGSFNIAFGIGMLFSERMKSMVRFFWGVLLGLGVYFPNMSANAADNAMRVYIGTYTGAKSKGIYVAEFDSRTGKLSTPELAVRTGGPSFLAIHPNRRFLYAVGETSNVGGKKEGAVRAFSIDPSTGLLSLLNEQPSGGSGPCHLSVDPTGRCVLVANYGSGSIAALPIGRDGKLAEAATTIQHEGSSIDRQRQTGPHAHFITTDPAGRFALACDLGLDKVLVYRFDSAKAALTANDPPAATVQPGAGPRHLAFHPNGRFVYVINEMGATLTAFAYDAERGRLEELQTLSTLPADFTGQKSCAEIQVHPSGKFMYGSNRGHDSIAVFSVDAGTGKLRFVECQPSQGKTPRFFGIDPTGEWLLAENQDSDTMVVFRVDAKSGRLSPTAQTVSVGSPVCAVFLPGK
jgi:6-phosphogluconolactonase